MWIMVLSDSRSCSLFFHCALAARERRCAATGGTLDKMIHGICGGRIPLHQKNVFILGSTILHSKTLLLS